MSILFDCWLWWLNNTTCRTWFPLLFYLGVENCATALAGHRAAILFNYDLFNRQQVKVCVYGKVLDENYSQILFANPDLDLETVFLIDCVQKRIKIDREAIKHLRKLKVIEGKSPNIFLSASVSENIGEQSQYVKNKAFNDQYYRNLIVKYLEQYGSAKKKILENCCGINCQK